jgi:hypothetical protein
METNKCYFCSVENQHCHSDTCIHCKSGYKGPKANLKDWPDNFKPYTFQVLKDHLKTAKSNLESMSTSMTGKPSKKKIEKIYKDIDSVDEAIHTIEYNLSKVLEYFTWKNK